jgi:predicted signal transduction protein with EAL and GGDEF domain
MILVKIIGVGLLVSCAMVLGFYWLMKRLGLWPEDSVRISTKTERTGTTII